MSADDRFAELGRPRNIWAVGAVQGDAERLAVIHDALAERLQPGDRIIYLGNYGAASNGSDGSMVAVVDELLAFRRDILALPGMMADDIIYLRGAQEEILQKLLQIQFAPNPRDVYAWMVKQGVGALLSAYGANSDEGFVATRDGAMTMTRWTNRLRGLLRQRPGHEKFLTVLRRAAYTERVPSGGVLFVHSGLDPSRPIGAQKDSFWWDHMGFEKLNTVYEGFTRVIRGRDPEGGGVKLNRIGVTLDGGCGAGGKLIAACVKPDGALTELIEV